jgi:hypothetical protein
LHPGIIGPNSNPSCGSLFFAGSATLEAFGAADDEVALELRRQWSGSTDYERALPGGSYEATFREGTVSGHFEYAEQEKRFALFVVLHAHQLQAGGKEEPPDRGMNPWTCRMEEC